MDEIGYKKVRNRGTSNTNQPSGLAYLQAVPAKPSSPPVAVSFLVSVERSAPARAASLDWPPVPFVPSRGGGATE